MAIDSTTPVFIGLMLTRRPPIANQCQHVARRSRGFIRTDDDVAPGQRAHERVPMLGWDRLFEELEGDRRIADLREKLLRIGG